MTNYPRPGCRIAPSLLKTELMVPGRAVDRRGIECTVMLADLDETVWQRFPVDSVQQLARQVIARITATLTMNMLSDSRKHQGMFVLKPPALPAGLTLMDLDLEESTIATLQKEGLFNDPDTFAAMSIRDLTMIPRFGSRRLVDLLTAMETCAAQSPEGPAAVAPAEAVAPWLARLRAHSGTERIGARDPRVGWQVRALDRQAQSVADLLSRVDAGTVTAADLGSRLRRLDETLARLQDLPLEEELRMTVQNCGIKPRHAEMLIRLRGWDGGGEGTLQSVGDAWGLTRERVRQITTQAEAQLVSTGGYLPRLQDVVDQVLTTLPAAADQVEMELLAVGKTAAPFRLDGVFSAARAFGIACPATLTHFNGRRLVVPPGLEELADVAWAIASRHVEQWGADRHENVAAAVSQRLGRIVSTDAVARVLAQSPQYRLLDAEAGWYWLDGVRRSRVLAHIEKIFCVCEEISVAELHEGLVRGQRAQEMVLPRGVLLELCRQTGWLEVNHWNMVRRLRAPEPERCLSLSERTICRILGAHGNIMSWGELKSRCTSAGMVKVTFDVTVMNSPVFKKIAKGTYGLRGTEVNSQTLAGCLPRGGFRPTRAKPEIGECADGRLFIVFRVTEYLMKSGLVFIPSMFRGRITHGRYELVDGDGRSLGRLSCYNGSNLYGLRRQLAPLGLGLDDAFRLTFDPRSRQVSLTRQAEVNPAVAQDLLAIA